ncbi:MAG: hypothetical protein KA275_00725 [Chitinophagaceae bacterium]|nr:hypothetical protein [Chitinophagaceae bacterium]
MNNPIKTILQCLLILIIQLFVLNDNSIKTNLLFFGHPVFTPIIYPFFLLLLPINIKYWQIMLWALFMGFVLDFFSNSPGIHSAVCVLIAYLRPFLLRLFYQQEKKELAKSTPNIFRLGFYSFISYISLSFVIHHFSFYLLQLFSVKNIGLIFVKTIISSLLTIFFILLIQILFYKKDQRKI